MWSRRPPAVIALLAAVPLLVLPSGVAFGSVPPGDSAHDRITRDAATPLGWSGTGLKELQKAIVAPDVSGTSFKVDGDGVSLEATDAYEPHYHCDRLAPTSHADAFSATTAYVRLERDLALQWSHGGQAERALDALGRALHAVQDCHSHSDVGEKDAAYQASFQAALLGVGPAPPGLRLTGFQPGADDPAAPPGDPYPHASYAKDGPDTNDDSKQVLPDGRTKFEAARALAVATTRMFLEDVMGRLNATEKAAIMDVPPPPAAKPSNVPSNAAWLVLAAFVGLAIPRWTRT